MYVIQANIIIESTLGATAKSNLQVLQTFTQKQNFISVFGFGYNRNEVNDFYLHCCQICFCHC